MEDSRTRFANYFPSNTAILIVVLFVIVLAGAWHFYGQKQPTPSESVVVEAQPTLAPTASPDATPVTIAPYTKQEGWITYTLPSVHLSFDLPGRSNSLGTLREQIVKGETGTQLCGQFSGVKVASESSAIQNTYCFTRPNDFLSIGTTSSDYAAGRGGQITDLQGFTEESGNIKLKFVGGSTADIPNLPMRTITTSEGVAILRIDGKSDGEGGPTLQNSLGDRVALIVNTNSPTYPGIVFVFENVVGYVPAEIDQIIASMHFTR